MTRDEAHTHARRLTGTVSGEGSNAEIAAYMRAQYGITVPLADVRMIRNQADYQRRLGR